MRIAGTGSGLIDFLYTDVDFTGPGFLKVRSKTAGDGGLTPGGLVLAEPVRGLRRPRVGCRSTRHRGRGPAGGEQRRRAFHRRADSRRAIARAARRRGRIPRIHWRRSGGRADTASRDSQPLLTEHYRSVPGASPSTYVLSDPNYNEGRGERSFIHDIGVAVDFSSEYLPESFFDSEVLLFGATSLVPRLHASLAELLEKGRRRGCLNVVGTVYDFNHEQADPGGRWPLARANEDLRFIDLLITNREEVLRISGANDIDQACRFLTTHGV